MNYRLFFLGSLFLAQLFFWIRTYVSRQEGNSFYTILFMMIFFIFEGISCVLYFASIKKITDEVNAEQQIIALEKEKELQLKQQEQINELQLQTKELQSSITDQLKNIKLHLQNGNPEKALNICSSFKEYFSQVRIPTYCNNPVLNAILHSKYEEAAAEEISVDYQIILPSDLDFPETVLPSIFFNLLDNGIHSCQRCKNEQRFIQLHTRFHANFLHIFMENTKNPDEKFSLPKTATNFSAHGFGLSIIEEIVNDYDGSFEWIDQSTTFQSVLMIRYKNNPTKA